MITSKILIRKAAIRRTVVSLSAVAVFLTAVPAFSDDIFNFSSDTAGVTTTQFGSAAAAGLTATFTASTNNNGGQGYLTVEDSATNTANEVTFGGGSGNYNLNYAHDPSAKRWSRSSDAVRG